MKTRISKSCDFDAAHWLPKVADGHKCKRMHGHTYRVEIIVDGEPDDSGMVVDYAAIAIVWESYHRLLDHRVLNDIPGLENPTTEVLAAFLFRMIDEAAAFLKIAAIRVYESSTTWCEVSR